MKKDLVRALIAAVVLTAIIGGWWYWQRISKKKELEQRLQEVEEQISATEKRIKELSELTPEELQKIEREREILSAESATKDVEVAGVEIMRDGGKKIIKNTAEGYRIEVPKNLLIARSISADWLELHDPEIMCEGDPLCSPILRIVVSKEDIKNILSQSAGYETINIGGANAYKVIEKIPEVFEGSYYYWSRSGKVYAIRVSSFDEPAYQKYIETFGLE